MSDITQPLSIKRTRLIERLKEVKAEHEAKRKEAQQAREDSRAVLLEAVGKLTDDQVANVLTHFVSSGQDGLVKLINEWVSESKFVSLDIEPTGVETNLDRQIRVFELAENTSIELKPSDSVYSYL